MAEAVASRVRNGYDSNGLGPRLAQTIREYTYLDFLKYQPLNFKCTNGVVGHTQWFKKIESVFNISNCTAACQVKYAACALQGVALTWWNSHVKTITLEVAQALPWKTLKKMMTDNRHFQELALMYDRMFREESDMVEKYIGGLPDMIRDSVKATRPKTMHGEIESATQLMDKRIRDVVENKRKFKGTSRNNHNQPHQNKRQNTSRAYAAGNSDRNIYTGSKRLCSKCDYHHEGPCLPRCNNWKRVGHLTRDCRSRPANANNNNTNNNNLNNNNNTNDNNRNNNNNTNNNNRNNNNNNQKGNGCYECRAQGHFKKNCPKLKNNNRDNKRQCSSKGAPHSPEYVPDPIELEDHVPTHIPEHPEDLVPAEDEAPIEMRAAVPSTYHSLLPSGTPPLLPIPLPVPSTNRRAEIPKADMPPQKRLLLTAPRPGCEVGESYAAVVARQPGPTMARSIDCSLVDTMETSKESSEFYSRHHDAQKDRAVVRAKIEAYSRALEARVAVLETQARLHEWQRHTIDDFAFQHIIRTHALEAVARIDTLEDTGLKKMASKRTIMSTQVPPVTPAPTATTTTVTEAQLQVLINQGVVAAMAEAVASRVRNGYDSNGLGPRLAQAVRECTYLDFLKYQPLNFKCTNGVVGHTQWFKKIESVFNISNYTAACQVKYAACALQGVALTWWNSHVKTITLEVAQALPWKTLKKMMTAKYCLRGEIKKLDTKMWELKTKGTYVIGYSRHFQELALMCDRMFREESDMVEKYIGGLPDTIHDSKFKGTSRNNQNQPHQNKRQNTSRAYAAGNSDRNIYTWSKPLCSKCDYHHEGPCLPRCNNWKRVGHLTRDCRSRPANANNNNNTNNNNRNNNNRKNNNNTNNNNRNNNNNNQKGNGVVRFGKRGKLNPRYVRPFKVLENIGKVAYTLELPKELSRVHSTFYVSNLKKCHAEEPLVVSLDGLHFDDKIYFVEEPVEIVDHEVKQLNRSQIPLVKVRWNSKRGPEFTWEREDQFRKKYPHLFTKTALSSSVTS
nr:putative reverse transcriptase domain-containing protein [Tanacetum cinerariifolium]